MFDRLALRLHAQNIIGMAIYVILLARFKLFYLSVVKKDIATTTKKSTKTQKFSKKEIIYQGYFKLKVR